MDKTFAQKTWESLQDHPMDIFGMKVLVKEYFEFKNIPSDDTLYLSYKIGAALPALEYVLASKNLKAEMGQLYLEVKAE